MISGRDVRGTGGGSEPDLGGAGLGALTSSPFKGALTSAPSVGTWVRGLFIP